MAEKFLAEAWGLQGAAIVFVGLQYVSRFTMVGWRKLSPDDGIMVIALAVYNCETIAAHAVVAWWKGLANSGLTEAQREAIDPGSEEFRLRVNGSKTHVIGLLLYTTLMWLLKVCWIFYYARLTDGVHRMNIRIRISWAVIPVTYVACLLVAFLKCIPFEKQWQIYPDPGNHCQPAFSFLQHTFVMGTNTITDIFLMAIPLPMVYKSNLPLKKKLTLLFMFSGGFLAMIFGILRCVSILTTGTTDPAQSGYWSIRESFVAVIVTNFPMVFPLFQRLYRSARGDHASRAGYSRDGSYPLNSYQQQKVQFQQQQKQTGSGLNTVGSCGSNNTRKKLKKGQEPLSGWGSDEAIVVAEQGKNRSVDERSVGSDGAGKRIAGSGGGVGAAEERCVISPALTNPGRWRDLHRDRDSDASYGSGIMVIREYTVQEVRGENTPLDRRP